jgi:cytochrome c-type biogenesis protein CcmE
MPGVAEEHEPQVLLRVARKGDLRRGRVLLVGTLVLSSAILVTVFASTKPKLIYSRSVSEFLAKPLLETTVRLEGVLVHGSLCKAPSSKGTSTCEYRFRLASSPNPLHAWGNDIEVRYEQCVVPDTFGDVPGFELSVVVEGELNEHRQYFDAKKILAKCPGKYVRPPGGWAHQAPARSVPPCP